MSLDISATLAREQWDFSRCPDDKIGMCHGYEYSRESPEVIAAYYRDKKRNRNFDKFGNWRTIFYSKSFDGDAPTSLVEMTLIPRGFPEMPFLLLHPRYKKPSEKLSDLMPAVEDGGPRDLALARKMKFPFCAALKLNWDASNKTLIKDFAKWLKKKRPHPARERRGESAARRELAELKALGAYRLLRNFTAEEALEYTRQFLPRGLYAKIPDWYEAKSRALKILKSRFVRCGNADEIRRWVVDDLRESGFH